MTDISEPLLGFAKVALADARVTFLPADACQLPFPDKVEAMKEAQPALASAGACMFRLLRSPTSL